MKSFYPKSAAGLFAAIAIGAVTAGIQADVLNPASPATDPLRPVARRTVDAPRGHIYGTVSRTSTLTEASQAFMGEIDLTARRMTPLYYGAWYAASRGDDYVFQGACYRKGYAYVASLGLLNEGTVWTVIDMANGNPVNTVAYDDLRADAYSMAWDSTNDKIYTIGWDDSSHSNFGVVDPATMRYTFIENIGADGLVAAIAYDRLNDRVLAFDINNVVYEVDRSNGRTVYAGELDAPFELFTENANGPLTYSPMDQAFVTIFRDNSSQGNRIFMIDADTFEATEVGKMTGRDDRFINDIFCTDDFADAAAPELPQPMVFDFAGNSLSGSVTIQAPSVTYYGDQIPAQTSLAAEVKAAGKSLFSGNLAPGESKTVQLTLAEGLYNFEYTCAIDGKTSPVRSQSIFVGNDHPKAPTRLTLNQAHLSWTAPGAVGYNNGFVDTKALSYNVYVDGVKQNASPVTACEYTLTFNGAQAIHTIEVEAVHAGNASPRASIRQVAGNAMELPAAIVPTEAEAGLFTVVNTMNDATTWMFTNSTTDASVTGMVMPVSQFDDADDWLIFPLMHFANADQLYQVYFDITGIYKNPSKESFDILLGRTLNPSDFTTEILRVDVMDCTPSPEQVEALFSVPEAGNYYIAIHCRSTKANSAKGIFVNNIGVRALEGSSAAVPAKPTDAVVVPAEKGALHASVSFTMPTADLLGRQLDANKPVTATLSCGDLSGTATALPGQKCSVETDVPELGFNTFRLVLSNDNGKGMTTSLRRYIGTDRPYPPTNIRYTTSEDNKTVHISWDPCPAEGVNGGYVDQENVTYGVFLRTGISYSKVGSTTKRSIDFAVSADKQASARIALDATTDGGDSAYSPAFLERLGKPYETPMTEEFPTSAFNYTPYDYETEGAFSGSTWENTRDVSSYGIMGCSFIQGGVIAFSESGAPTEAGLRFPKFTTSGMESLNLTIRFWDYSSAPKIYIRARSFASQDFQTIKEIAPNKPFSGAWRDETFELPAELLNQPWVEIELCTSLTGGMSEYLVVDSYELSTDYDYDLKLSSIEGPAQVSVGDTPEYTFLVQNAGTRRNSGTLTVQTFKKNGTKVAEQVINVPTIQTKRSFEGKARFEINGEFADEESLVIKAFVSSNNDMVDNNNERQIAVAVRNSQLPTVRSLRIESDEEAGTQTLTWRKPTVSYGDLEDFELDLPFQNPSTIGSWQNVDLDDREPAQIENGALKLEWPGSDAVCAWTVVRPSEIGLSSEERLQPHSGAQMAMARALFSEAQGVSYQAADWLISPEIKGGSQISFWFNTIASDFTEYVELWYSETGTTLDETIADGATRCGDFSKLRSFSKVGSDLWEFCSATLPRNAKYVALVYRSYDSLAAMIDDVQISPVESKEWDIDHYAVFRSLNGAEPQCILENTVDRSFVDNTPTSEDMAVYFVRSYVVAPDGRVLESPKSNTVTYVGKDYSGVGSVESLKGVAGGRGEIIFSGLQGVDLHVFDASGQLLHTVSPSADTARLPIAPGIYVVVSDTSAAKVLVR